MRIQINWILKILLVHLIIACCLLTTYKHRKLNSLFSSFSISSTSSSLQMIETNETTLAIKSLYHRYPVDIHHLLSGIYSRTNGNTFTKSYYFLLPNENQFLEWRKFCETHFHSNIFRYLSIPNIENFSQIPSLEIFKPCLSSLSLDILSVPTAISSLNRTLIVISTYNSLFTTLELLQSLQKISKENYDLLVIDDRSTDGTQEYLQKLVSQ